MKVGHTGTLDPLASGVLPLVIGKATRLAQFLSSSEKEYEADIELGVSTTTLDRGGEVVSRAADSRDCGPDRRHHRRGRGGIPRHLSAAAADLLGQEGGWRPRVRPRPQKRAGAPGAGRR